MINQKGEIIVFDIPIKEIISYKNKVVGLTAGGNEKKEKVESKKKVINLKELSGILLQYKKVYDIKIIVEEVIPMNSNTNTDCVCAFNFGQLTATINLIGLEYETIHPRSWGPIYGKLLEPKLVPWDMIGMTPKQEKDYKYEKRKDASRELAKKLYPNGNYFNRKCDNGRSDATLLANILKNNALKKSSTDTHTKESEQLKLC
jgi:hypothetical protein